MTRQKSQTAFERRQFVCAAINEPIWYPMRDWHITEDPVCILANHSNGEASEYVFSDLRSGKPHPRFLCTQGAGRIRILWDSDWKSSSGPFRDHWRATLGFDYSIDITNRQPIVVDLCEVIKEQFCVVNRWSWDRGYPEVIDLIKFTAIWSPR